MSVDALPYYLTLLKEELLRDPLILGKRSKELSYKLHYVKFNKIEVIFQ